MPTGLGIDNVLGHTPGQHVGDLTCCASSQFFDRFLRKKCRVWCCDDPLVGKEGVGKVGGFGVEDVQGEAADLVTLESLPGGGVIDQSAT